MAKNDTPMGDLADRLGSGYVAGTVSSTGGPGDSGLPRQTTPQPPMLNPNPNGNGDRGLNGPNLGSGAIRMP